jgi:ethanolamine phosphate transferase 2 subunit G
MLFRLSRKRVSDKSRMALFLALLSITRVSRRWNQTGQKFVGEPDIARTFLPKHTSILWLLAIATYLEVARRIAMNGFPRAPRQFSIIAAFAICAAAISFKISFTNADAPELLEGIRHPFQHFMEAPLVSQAQAVFFGLGVAAFYALCDRIRPGGKAPGTNPGSRRALDW